MNVILIETIGPVQSLYQIHLDPFPLCSWLLNDMSMENCINITSYYYVWFLLIHDIMYINKYLPDNCLFSIIVMIIAQSVSYVDHISGKVVVSDVDMCQDKYIFRFFNVLCKFKTTNTSRMSMLMSMTVILFLPKRQAVVISTTHIFLELHPKYQEYYFLLTVSRSLSSSNTRSLSPSLHLSSCTKRFKHILISL